MVFTCQRLGLWGERKADGTGLRGCPLMRLLLLERTRVLDFRVSSGRGSEAVLFQVLLS